MYKVPLLISITLGIVIISLRVEREVLPIAAIIIGCLLGTFTLDADYFIYAFFMEPAAEFSQMLAGFIKHRDIQNTLSYIHYHKNDIRDKTLNSIFFQIVLAAASLLVVSSDSGRFIKALIVATFANSIYKLTEHYFENTLDLWFWALKNKPTKRGGLFYIISFVAVLVFCLSLF